MPEAFVEPWQDFVEEETKVVTKKILVAACNLLKVNLVSSQPLLQGKMSELALPNKFGVYNNVARHLQLVRSIPTRCLITALVGMKDTRHVRYNLGVPTTKPLTHEEFLDVMVPQRRKEYIEPELNQ